MTRLLSLWMNTGKFRLAYLNDILEEIVGDFTSSVSLDKKIKPESDGSYVVDGSMMIREFNRLTGWELPPYGPRTINGLIIEHLEALPRTETGMRIAGYPIEIIKVKDNRVRSARIFPKLKAKTYGCLMRSYQLMISAAATLRFSEANALKVRQAALVFITSIPIP